MNLLLFSVNYVNVVKGASVVAIRIKSAPEVRPELADSREKWGHNVAIHAHQVIQRVRIRETCHRVDGKNKSAIFMAKTEGPAFWTFRDSS